MLAETIFYVLGLILIAIVFREIEKLKNTSQIAIIVLIIGVIALSVGAYFSGNGTAKNAYAIGSEIPDGIYIAKSDVMFIYNGHSTNTKDETLILLVSITAIQQNSSILKEEPKYYDFGKDATLPDLKSGDLIIATSGNIKKYEFGGK